MSRARWSLAVVAAIALVLTLAHAAAYATLNQATYLLDPLHRAMPELFRRDWFVNDTPPYLPVFGWLAQWLYVVDGEGTIAIPIAQLIVNLATYVAMFALVDTLHGGWRAFAIVASFATITKGLSMGGSYLLAGYLQPSSLATLGWVIGMAALARDRYLACGIAVALAGALHANFLVLGLGLFGLAALARRDLTLRDYAKVLGPQLAVLACFVPTLLAAAGPSDRAVWILTTFHAPIHYAPDRLAIWILHVLAWQVGAYAALHLLEGSKPARVLWRFSLVACAIVTISALLIRYTPLEWLTQVRWSRIGPFGQLACLAIIVCALVRQVVAPRPLTPRARVLVGLGLLVPLYQTWRHLYLVLPLYAICIGAGVLLVALVPRQRIASAALTALAVLALAYALWTSPRGEGLSSTPSGSADERSLAGWARSETPVDTLFLAPPDLYRFRLLARRAVIVDTKSPPLRPDLLVQWYERVCAMVLYPDAPSFQAADARYAQLTQAELERVARSFGADYIIVDQRTAFAEPPVYRNDDFAVYRAPR